jgi:enoyl-CoA hydratase/carnithine racemase
VPTIAAVDGAAIGLGMDYALACDMRLIGPAGWLQQGWARAGLIAGTGGVGLLHRLNPTALWRIVGTQPRLDAAACVSLGLGEEAATTALAAARERADSFQSIPRVALREYCQLSREASWPAESHFRQSARVQAGLIRSETFRDTARQLLGR